MSLVGQRPLLVPPHNQLEAIMPEPHLKDKGIICPRCDGPCGLDHTDEVGQEYLCLTCGARVRVRGKADA